jgi:hypothetical protein
MHMAPRAAAWVAWAVWTCNTPSKGMRSKESGLRSALFFVRPEFVHGLVTVGVDTVQSTGRDESFSFY